MRRFASLLCWTVACVPAAAPPAAAPAPVAASVEAPARADSCQRDIPDCEAACALRETGRTEHLEWFDRRCAAVVLGRNPDKAVGYTAPAPPPEAAPVVVAPPPRPTAPTPSMDPDPFKRPAPTFDPFADRNGATHPAEPAECSAARTMRARGQSREADMLGALCTAKGGSETLRRVDLGF